MSFDGDFKHKIVDRLRASSKNSEERHKPGELARRLATLWVQREMESRRNRGLRPELHPPACSFRGPTNEELELVVEKLEQDILMDVNRVGDSTSID